MNLERGLGLTEGLAIFGLAQCLLIVSYILIRTQDRHQVLFPLIYFGALALAFALRIGVAVCFEPGCYTDTPVWLVELAFPPLSFLLILQVAENRFVGGRVFLIGLVPIIAIGLGLAVAGGTRVCADGMFCSEAMNILEVFGVLSAGACLLVVWLYCRLLERLVRQPSGWDRYWLALSLIAMIGIGEGLRLMGVGGMLDVANAEEARLVIQITLVYLASTLLFRIYPQPVPLAGSTRVRKPQFDVLTEQDRHIALKVRELMDVDKLYQEPAFGRADLAREVGVPEHVISRVVNAAFGKGFRNMLNEYRVAEAQDMLKNTGETITTIAFEVGFNSLASFNRAFRDIAGMSPSECRSKGD